jgi:hypothetical protein
LDESKKSNPFSEWTISCRDAERRVVRAVRTSMGYQIRELYSGIPDERIPPKIAELLNRLERPER